jgi:branched-chain amino acid aminotransferase
LKEKPGPDH